MTRPALPYTVLRMRPDVNYVEGHAPIVFLKSDTNIRLATTFKRFGVGAVPVGGTGRNERGIEQPGPWAYAFGLCTVIDNNPERRQREYDADVIVDAGTILMIDAKCYKVIVVRGEFIELHPVATPAIEPYVGELKLPLPASNHRYTCTVTRDICGNRPYLNGEQFDRIIVTVDANNRTQAASRVKKWGGWQVDDVNMIG